MGKRTIIKVTAARAGLALAVGLCLFGGVPAAQGVRGLGSVLREMAAACHDRETQWMVMACAGMYAGTFILLRHRRTGGRWWRWDNPKVWLAGVLAFAALRYALDYDSASSQLGALVLVGGVALGKGAALLAGVTRGAVGVGRGTLNFEHRTLNFEGGVSQVRVIGNTLLVLSLLAVFLQNEMGRQFQYRGAVRWSGPWENPNLYGLLMGTGLVLAVGLLVGSLVQRPRSKGQSQAKGECGVRSAEGGMAKRDDGGLRMAALLVPFHRFAVSPLRGFLGHGLRLAAALVFAVALVKSYSRGAWVGTALGLSYLAYQVIRPAGAQGGNRETRERRERLLTTCDLSFSRSSRVSRWRTTLWRNRAAVVVSLVSAGILLFAGLRQSEGRLARRVASVANANDFSWRNRLAAWEGALQIMADYPWAGAGWNQPEPLYNQFYKPPQVEEGMAIQLNDYLTLGMTLGIPALGCFIAYVVLRLRPKSRVQGPKSEAGSSESNAQRPLTPALSPSDGERVPVRAGTLDSGLWTLDWLAAVCRAGALVLLVGFWFDGGLFKLPTAVVFWTLLEVSAEVPSVGDQSAG